MSGVRVEVTRGGRVESVHHVDAAVVDAKGRVVARAGRPEEPAFVRSAVKPFQALPLIHDGVAERFGLTDEELALCCASHSGEPRHVEVARSILGKLGMTENALACGPHRPFNREAADRLGAEGETPGRVHNNCSGKHGGMLALALAHGWETEGYQGDGHPVQERMLDEISRWTEVARDRIDLGVDGCGVVTFALPLTALAGAFARLAEAAARGESGAERVLRVMRAHPFLVGGSDRLCTRLMEVTEGRLVAKVGAEGVYGAVAVDQQLGIALKARDGARRAAEVSLLGILEAMELIRPEELQELGKWARPELKNTRDERVGGIRPVVVLEEHG